MPTETSRDEDSRCGKTNKQTLRRAGIQALVVASMCAGTEDDLLGRCREKEDTHRTEEGCRGSKHTTES